MPLPASFPPPPPIPRATPMRASNVPTADTPSVRTFHSSSEPLYPIPMPSPHSTPLPSSLGQDVHLFHCHCAPRCIEFIKPRDHVDLQSVGLLSSAQPLRSRVIVSGPEVDGEGAEAVRKKGKTKLTEFDVDSKVAYEFNVNGFYSELLRDLDAIGSDLSVTHRRSHQFLHATRSKYPHVQVGPQPYVPYYPSHHLAAKGRAFAKGRPIADAEQIAAAVRAPTNGSTRQDDEEKLAISASHGPAVQSASEASPVSLPSHLHLSSTDSSSASSGPLSASRARARLLADRSSFTEQLFAQLRAQMSIQPSSTPPPVSLSSSVPQTSDV